MYAQLPVAAFWRNSEISSSDDIDLLRRAKRSHVRHEAVEGSVGEIELSNSGGVVFEVAVEDEVCSRADHAKGQQSYCGQDEETRLVHVREGLL